MDPFYILYEVQVNDGVVSALPPIAFTDSAQASSRYHGVLSSAAIAQIDYDGAFLVRDDGVITEGRAYGLNPLGIDPYYIVIEIQMLNGVPAAIEPVYGYRDPNQAKSAYYQMCASAAIGTSEYDAIMIIDNRNMIYDDKKEIFDRRPKPEADETEQLI